MNDEQKLLAACVDYRAMVDKLQAENAALNETTKKHVEAYYELLAQNANLKEALDAQMKYQRELRADRDRLDWVLSHNGRNWFFRTLENGEWIASMGAVRGFIDAAMEKEAQP